jgi:hypothetical protein
MCRTLIEWWGGRSPGLRAALACGVLGASTLLWFLSGNHLAWKRPAVAGWVAGAVLLLASFPNQAERRAYHDF